jgi:hypothetical protein
MFNGPAQTGRDVAFFQEGQVQLPVALPSSNAAASLYQNILSTKNARVSVVYNCGFLIHFLDLRRRVCLLLYHNHFFASMRARA